MVESQLFADGEHTNALICFTDINGFRRIASSVSKSDLVSLMKEIASITARAAKEASGCVVKYIGDSSLLAFPESSVNVAIRSLVASKASIEKLITDRTGIETVVSYALHFGEVSFAVFEPFETVDVLGETVNIAASLDRGRNRGRFVITPQVFRKLAPDARKLFHKFTPPIVYVSE